MIKTWIAPELNRPDHLQFSSSPANLICTIRTEHLSILCSQQFAWHCIAFSACLEGVAEGHGHQVWTWWHPKGPLEDLPRKMICWCANQNNKMEWRCSKIKSWTTQLSEFKQKSEGINRGAKMQNGMHSKNLCQNANEAQDKNHGNVHSLCSNQHQQDRWSCWLKLFAWQGNKTNW